MMASTPVAYTLLLIFLLSNSVKSFPQTIMTRSDFEQDEGSCICGINKAILDQLESIVIASTSGCPNKQQESSVVPVQPQARDPDTPVMQSIMSEVAQLDQKPTPDLAGVPSFESTSVTTNETTMPTASLAAATVNSLDENQQQQINNTESNSTARPSPQSWDQLGAGFNSLTFDLVAQLTSEIHKLQMQLNSIQNQEPQQQQQHQQQQTPPAITPPSVIVTQKPSVSSSSSYGLSWTQSSSASPTVSADAQREPKKDEATQQQTLPGGNLVISGFLEGLPAQVYVVQNEVLSKLNYSHVVGAHEMTNALESTVPNVVSNIFSSIQNLTLLTAEQTQDQQVAGSSDSGKLTSIDGSSVAIHNGESKDEITASGEKLFLVWVEHQLESLHITASVAKYIRKSALNMFRRIVIQYVDRITKVGGSVERATQLALDNTQHLMLYFLRNNLNFFIRFGGGLMQIIGEQVSRVGKQLDSTGDKIATANLNPFDIVSSVIDSLPNPANYSKYFREWGKNLIGESTTTTTPLPSLEGTNSTSDPNNEVRPHGIITKTMGALSKTLTKLLG